LRREFLIFAVFPAFSHSFSCFFLFFLENFHEHNLMVLNCFAWYYVWHKIVEAAPPDNKQSGGMTMKTCNAISLFMALVIVLGLTGASLAGQAVLPDISGHATDQDKGIVQQAGAFGGYTGQLSPGIMRIEGKAQSAGQGTLIRSDADMFKVLSVLEKRIGDRELLDKVKHKLPALSEKRLKMLASLSDHMAAGTGEPENSIAFLLIATLIIFS
jgi:hypothetical protein